MPSAKPMALITSKNLKKPGVVLLFSFLSNGCQSAIDPVLPQKYLEVVEISTFSLGKPPTKSARWRMQFPVLAGKKQFSLPPGSDVLGSYISTSAFIIKRDGAKSPLPIQYKEEKFKDLEKNDYSIIRPTIEMPSLENGEVIEANFSKVLSSNASTHYLPGQFGTERATIEKADIYVVSEGVPVRVDAVGFSLGVSSVEADRQTRHFSILPESKKFETRSGSSAVKVSATMHENWDSVSAPIRLAYKAELAKTIDSGEMLASLPADIIARPPSQERTRILANHIFKLVVRNFRYRTAAADPNFSNLPRPIEKTWKSRKGDCKDFTLIFIKLLAAVGIQAEPVMVPSIDHPSLARMDTLPSVEQFDHVIVSIPEIDEYSDLTAGKDEYLTSISDQYARTFGLHVFSSEYKAIKPNKWSDDIRMRTVFVQRNQQWVAHTTWVGKGFGHMAVRAVNNYLVKNRSKENPKSFERNGLTLRPETWIAANDELNGVSSVAFDYTTKQNLVDEDGMLIRLPFNFTSGALLKYDLANSAMLVPTRSCFDHYYAEEVIEMVGIRKVPNFVKIGDVKINGIAKEFTQTIRFSDGVLTINRNLKVNESRVVCPLAEDVKNSEFYKAINSIRRETTVTMTRS